MISKFLDWIFSISRKVRALGKLLSDLVPWVDNCESIGFFYGIFVVIGIAATSCCFYGFNEGVSCLVFV